MPALEKTTSKQQVPTSASLIYHDSDGKLVEKLSFWGLANVLITLTEKERITHIESGLEHYWLPALKHEFRLTLPALAGLANVSSSTLERRLKSKTHLDPVASERIDRLAQVAMLAQEVFEDKDIASEWMATPNDALGGSTPLALCNTELGARQVRRVLHAIEWGGVA